MSLNESGKKHRHNKSWMQEHVNDPYVKRAKAEGWRSRAAFKLIEIDAKDKLLKPGMTVVDLGSAPGSWSQVAAKKIKPKGILVALDLLEMEPIPDATFIRGDFREDEVLAELEETLAGRQVDLVLSDIFVQIPGTETQLNILILHHQVSGNNPVIHVHPYLFLCGLLPLYMQIHLSGKQHLQRTFHQHINRISRCNILFQFQPHFIELTVCIT